MNSKIWQWIGDYCSGALDGDEERQLHEWMDESEENRQFFIEGVKMVREYQMVANSDKRASDSLKRVQEKIRIRGRRKLWIQITAAASVVLLFSLSYMFFYISESREDFSELMKVHAGGTKATLIVADGIQVDLTQDNLTPENKKEIYKIINCLVLIDGKKFNIQGAIEYMIKSFSTCMNKKENLIKLPDLIKLEEYRYA